MAHFVRQYDYLQNANANANVSLPGYALVVHGSDVAQTNIVELVLDSSLHH